MKDPSKDEPDSALWPQTDWSGLGRAATSPAESADFLHHLILKYHLPLRVYLVSSFPSVKNAVDEILQDFAQDRMLKEGWLAKAKRERGKFRQLLKTSLRNYVKDRFRSHTDPPLSLEELEFDPALEESAGQAFDLNWARAVVAESLARMEQDCQTPGERRPQRSRIWEVFRLRILLPALEDAEPVGYDELVRQTGLVSPIEAQNLLATAKRIFNRHLTAVISEYEREGEATRMELADIRHFLETATRRKGE